MGVQPPRHHLIWGQLKPRHLDHADAISEPELRRSVDPVTAAESQSTKATRPELAAQGHHDLLAAGLYGPFATVERQAWKPPGRAWLSPGAASR